MIAISRTVRIAAFCLLPLALAGCGGSSWFEFSGFDPTRVGSELSIFGLRGKKPEGSLDAVNFRGASVRADQQATPGGTETGYATVAVYFGGYGYADEEELRRDHINLSTFGTLSTDLTRRTDSGGGAEDRFLADGWTPKESVNYYTEAAKLVLRNMDGGDGTGLNYATYGYWAAEFDSFHRLVAFTLADPDVYPTLPPTGEATYQGSMTGLYSEGYLATNQAAEGDASLLVDFDDNTVSGQITGITAGGQSLREVALQETALAGTTFRGTAATLTAGAGQTGPEMAGDYTGGLYGLLAPEAVGTFALTGASGEALVGGFAAQQ
jgi:hypothetical protein